TLGAGRLRFSALHLVGQALQRLGRFLHLLLRLLVGWLSVGRLLSLLCRLGRLGLAARGLGSVEPLRLLRDLLLLALQVHLLLRSRPRILGELGGTVGKVLLAPGQFLRLLIGRLLPRKGLLPPLPLPSRPGLRRA